MGNGKWEMGSFNRSAAAADHRGYRALDALKQADDSAVEIYALAAGLKGQARALASQIIRAATSAPANITEGYGGASQREFRQFLTVSHASLFEVSYFLHFLNRVAAIDKETYQRLSNDCDRAARVVYGLMRAVSAQARADGRAPRYLNQAHGAPK